MTRFRITVRADEPTLELRGYTDLPPAVLNSMADALKPYGVVVASIAEDDYDPFDIEQIIERAVESVDKTVLGSSAFADAVRDATKQAIRNMRR